MSASRAVMSSVINEAEPFEAAAAASVRERVVTACNVPASAAPVIITQTRQRACPATLGAGAGQLLQVLQNEGTRFSAVVRAFSKRAFV